MRNLLFCLILCLTFGFQNAVAQCDFITPATVKKVNYANREVTFSDVTMNGKATTYLAVNKGETVKITTNLVSRKNGDYCPSCIVQIYWGIRGYTSVCAESFYGYSFNRKKSTLKFEAPQEDGIYYITMGGTLDYSCKNNIYRPACSADDAFAVLKVGNPDPEQKLTLVKADKGTGQVLRTTLVKSGCFGDLDKIAWFLDGNKLPYDDQKEIPLSSFGIYKVTWSSCLTSVSKTISHKSNNTFLNNNISLEPSTKEKKLIPITFGQDLKLAKTATKAGDIKLEIAPSSEEADIATLVENNEKFVLKNLIFDLSRWEIKPEAQQDLDKLAQVMKDNPLMTILLEGHTDKRGSTKQNMVLSEKRVKSTKDYLVKQGVLKANIQTKGWGDQKPLIVTSDIEEGKINRRVEVRILTR